MEIGWPAFLRSPNKWRELWAFHNFQVSRPGGNGNRIFRIQNPDMIFVEQILYLPESDKHKLSSPTEIVTKAHTWRPAIAIDLKIAYAFGYDEKPIVYFQEASDCIIKAEMRGKISIEIHSHDRYRQIKF